ncbi:6-phosphogluconolactonase [Oscillatoria sp. FACHB-1406]|uniref:6-phosphogluconolactonase n=1 Tax=Oscillatoria sp. FACHB-1406 TaxID=2692846 RepID=UPI001687E7BC|nr:6-phosphogluconolactonase [Oscillatoria sp. FACHB-1406]MBD2576269.1 6-phosphogluconolactonase [Oscillatoria sp. FACHB-1406]
MNRVVEVVEDKSALIARSLALTVEKIMEATRDRGQCTIALSGGSTPKPLYEAIAAQSLPWDKIHVFWGDERYVPPTDPDSNEGMARGAWLDRVALPPENIHPMPTGASDPAADAETHDAQLRDFFKSSAGEFPEFDIILLGMGDDGHTASLFPHTEALDVRDRLITVGNKDGQPRLTFTVPLINRARCVIFVVAGTSKQPALEQIFAETADERAYPSRQIQPAGELYWLLDRAAGEAIEQRINF